MGAFWKTPAGYINPEHASHIWSEQDGSVWAVRVHYPTETHTIKTGYSTQADAEDAIIALLSSVIEIT